MNAEASNAGCVVLAYMRSGANESCGVHSHFLDTLDPQAYADVVMYLVLTGQRAAPTFDERFDSAKFALRYDRFLSSLLRRLDVSLKSRKLKCPCIFAVRGVRGSAYLERLARRSPFNIVETEAPDVSVASCLDGGCADGWSDDCQREAFAVAAKAPLSLNLRRGLGSDTSIVDF